MLDKKTFAIGVLSLSALILFIANLIAPRPVHASYETIQDNDYWVQTGKAPQGGDAIFVTDKRTGKMAAFVFDPNQRRLVPLDVQPIQNAFAALLKKN
jgi:hypothetical protein